MSNLKDKIWITYKTRTFSEKRFRLYDRCSHLSLAYMSLLMILATVFSEKLAKAVPHFDVIIITVPLFLFTVTLIILGYRYSRTADDFRECYLKLQALEQNFDNEDDPIGAYHNILACYPNHSPWDYENLVLERTLFGNETLHIGDMPIKWRPWMLLRKVLRTVAFYLFVGILPISVTYLLLQPFIFGSGTTP